QADALDADHLRSFGPFAEAHVQLGMVDAERLDLDHDVARLGLRLGDIGVDQAVETAELLQDDGAHDSCSFEETLYWGTRKSRMAGAISAAWVSSAKCPVSSRRTTASGMSRLNASAPAGRKKGSWRPQVASNGGRSVRKYFWKTE